MKSPMLYTVIGHQAGWLDLIRSGSAPTRRAACLIGCDKPLKPSTRGRSNSSTSRATVRLRSAACVSASIPDLPPIPCASSGSARAFTPPLPHFIVYSSIEADLFSQRVPRFRNSSRRTGRPRRQRHDPVFAPGIGNGSHARGGRAGEPFSRRQIDPANGQGRSLPGYGLRYKVADSTNGTTAADVECWGVGPGSVLHKDRQNICIPALQTAPKVLMSNELHIGMKPREMEIPRNEA